MLVSDEDGGNFQIGTPTLKNMYAEAKILEHGRGVKIRVFKMKPRKRYRRTLGHRQDYTVIEVTKLVTGKTPAKPASKEEKTVSKKPITKPIAKKKPTTKKAPAKKVEKTPKKS